MTPGGRARREGRGKTKEQVGVGQGKRIRKVFAVRNKGKRRKDMYKDRTVLE